MSGLEELRIDTGEAVISVSRGGAGPPVLLLHGFPQTKLMWRDIAPRLAQRFTVVCADLRGYGQSSTPPSSTDHAPYSKRAMARDMISVMAQLGFEHFFIAGHDRGGRVAYRAALDHPERVDALAVLDVLPVGTVWDRADDRLALGFWPWSLLAQPEPLPERLIGAAPDAVIDNALSPEWGSPAATFDGTVRAAYTAALGDPEHLHAICEEYRAAAGIDRDHDAADRAAGRRISCPLLVLWSASGPLSSWYDDVGGPLALWRDLAAEVTGEPVDGGHFFPEERPAAVAAALSDFFSGCSAASGDTRWGKLSMLPKRVTASPSAWPSQPLPVAQRHSGLGPDPGRISVQVPGVWPGGRVPTQVSFSRLNHGPSADDRTAKSATATGYLANLPSAQLGTHWFSQSVPCPAAAEAVQAVQVNPSIRRPASAHVSTIDDGSLLSVCGSAVAQSATTPTSATGAAELGAVAGAGAFVGPVVGVAAAPVGEAVTVEPIGEAAAAVPVGAPAAVDVELFLAVPLGAELHPATAAPIAAQRTSVLNVCFMPLKTNSIRGGLGRQANLSPTRRYAENLGVSVLR